MSYHVIYEGTLETQALSEKEQKALMDALLECLTNSARISFVEQAKGPSKQIIADLLPWYSHTREELDVGTGLSAFVFILHGDGTYPEEHIINVLSALAPFIERGEIQYTGEEAEHWRFLFKDGQWIEQAGRVVYDEDG